MLRLSLFATALLTVTASDIRAQGAESHALPISVTTLGTYLPQLEDTLSVFAQNATDAPAEDRTIAGTAWQVLAFSGAGSSMRSGRHKRPLKALTIWLARQQTSFRHNPNTPRPSRVDSILMSLAFARIGSESNFSLLNRYMQWSMEMWLPGLCTPRLHKPGAGKKDAPPLTSDETLLLALLAQTLKDTKFRAEQQQVLALATGAVAATPTDKDRRADGVRHYLEVVAGTQHPPQRTAARCWPGDELADPLHTWFGAFALRLLPPAIRASHRDRTTQLLDKRHKDHLWPASGGRNRLTTSAMLVAAIGMTASEETPPKSKPDATPKQKGDPWNGPIR